MGIGKSTKILSMITVFLLLISSIAAGFDDWDFDDFDDWDDWVDDDSSDDFDDFDDGFDDWDDGFDDLDDGWDDDFDDDWDDFVPYWMQLDNQYVSEDSPDNTTAYPNLAQMCVTESGAPDVQVMGVNQHFELFFSGNDLLLRNLETDWRGVEQVWLNCEGMTASFALYAINVNDAPLIQPPVPGISTPDDTMAVYDLSGHEYDVDNPNAELVWVVSNPDDTYFDALITGKVLYISPKVAGFSQITLTLSDPNGAFAAQVVNVTITGIPNIAPEINPPVPFFNVAAGDLFFYGLEPHQYDPDNSDGELFWTIAGLSNPYFDAGINNGNELEIDAISPGVANITLVLSDIHGATDFQTVTITIYDTTPNDAPQITPPVPNLNTEIGSVLTYSLASYEFDADNTAAELAWSAANPDDTYFDVAVVGKELVVTPKSIGAAMITLILTDPFGETDTQIVWITISDAPSEAPRITPPVQDFTATEGSAIRYSLASHEFDADSSPEELSWTVASAGNTYFDARIDGKELVITPKKAGSGRITITLTDADGFSDSQDINVNVLTRRGKSVSEETGIFVSKVRIENGGMAAGNMLSAHVTMENSGNVDLDDIKLTMIVQELAARGAAGPFDLERGDKLTKNVVLRLGDEPASGSYYARFTISNGKAKRVFYRPILIP